MFHWKNSINQKTLRLLETKLFIKIYNEILVFQVLGKMFQVLPEMSGSWMCYYGASILYVRKLFLINFF